MCVVCVYVCVYWWTCMLKCPLFYEMILTWFSVVCLMSLLNKMKRSAILWCWASVFKKNFLPGSWNPSLGTTNLHYPNKQNNSNKLISQSSALISNPAPTMCSLYHSENDQTRINLVLSYRCLKCFPCSHVLELPDNVPTSPPAPFCCTQHSSHVLWWLVSPPDFCTGAVPPTSPPLSQLNAAQPSAQTFSVLLWGVFMNPPGRGYMYPPCALTATLTSLVALLDPHTENYLLGFCYVSGTAVCAGDPIVKNTKTQPPEADMRVRGNRLEIKIQKESRSKISGGCSPSDPMNPAQCPAPS